MNLLLQETPVRSDFDCEPFKQVQGTEAEVCLDIAQRQSLGIMKYHMTVGNNPLPLKRWLQHAYEECLDQAIYLKRAMQELDSL